MPRRDCLQDKLLDVILTFAVLFEIGCLSRGLSCRPGNPFRLEAETKFCPTEMDLCAAVGQLCLEWRALGVKYVDECIANT